MSLTVPNTFSFHFLDFPIFVEKQADQSNPFSHMLLGTISHEANQFSIKFDMIKTMPWPTFPRKCRLK